MALKLYPSRQFGCIFIGIVSFWLFALSAVACEQTTTVKDASLDEIKRFFESQNKKVITFVGYSGAEYNDKAAMLKEAERILNEFDASKTIVNIGATPEGIGAVYEIAKSKGFKTTGILSSQAKKYSAELSACVDIVFYVEDAAWGGFLTGSDQLSPTSTAMVANSDVLIGIGGGEIARDELMAAKRSGKKIRFVPADMNHQKARHRAQKKGLPPPTNFGGAAAEVFNNR